MKSTIASLLLLSGLTVSVACFGMEGLPEEAYQARALKFLKRILIGPKKDIKDTCDLDKKVLKKYLEERISKAEKILAGDKSFAEKELSMLDVQTAFDYTMNVDINPNARVYYYYPSMVQENLAFLLRKKLGCYRGEKLFDFEKEYEKPLEKVDEAEFGSRRRKAFDNDAYNFLLLEGSRDFAQAILGPNSTDSL